MRERYGDFAYISRGVESVQCIRDINISATAIKN